MTKKSIILLMVLLTLSATVFAQRSGTQQAVQNYYLTVNANVNGTVYIDGSYVGKTGSAFSVKAGTHSVKVTADGYLDYVSSVNVSKSMTVYAELEPQTFNVRISASMPGAQLWINGKDYGFLSFEVPFVLQLPKGTINIVVSLNGYYDYLQTINITKDMTIFADLKPMMATLELVILKENLVPIRNALAQIELYVDDVKQKEHITEVTAGVHVLMIQSGGLRFAQQFNFIAGKYYLLTPFFELLDTGGK